MSIKNFRTDPQTKFRKVEVKINEFNWYKTDQEEKYFRIPTYCNNEQITFKQNAKLVSINNKLIPLESELSEIKNAIDESSYILSLHDDWDDNGAKAPSKGVYNKAIKFLVEYANAVLQNHRTVIKAPEINPGKNGSIDLDWRCSQAELLINVTDSNDFLACYYGDNGNSNLIIEGFLRQDELNEDLAHWMRKLN